MSITTRIFTCFYSAILSLICASSLLAAGQEPAQSGPWSCWHAMHWPAYWWIFPLLFFVLIVAICVCKRRKGGRGWMCCWPGMDKAEFRDTMKRSWGEPSESAMEILNKRYAKGEIDKQEYEEIKASFISSE